MTPNELRLALRQFTGTEHWYRHNPTSLVYTDGVQYFAEKAGAYWFLDIVGTEVLALRMEFAVVKLVSKDNAGSIVVEDGNGNISWEKKLDFTDAPEGVWSFYLQDKIIIIPSEY